MLEGFGHEVSIVLAKSARDLRSRALRTRRAACTFAPGEIKGFATVEAKLHKI